MNPPGAVNFTSEPHNLTDFNGDHNKWVLIGIVHMQGPLWRWCQSLTFIGCPARTSFIPPRVCNFVLVAICHKDFSIFSLVFATRITFIFLAFNLSVKMSVLTAECQEFHCKFTISFRISPFTSLVFVIRITFVFLASSFWNSEDKWQMKLDHYTNLKVLFSNFFMDTYISQCT